MKQVLLALTLIILLQTSYAQVAISNPASAPHASAMLDVKSADRGFLMPRVALRTDVASPATGLLVYETTSNAIWVYNGTAWAQLGSSGGASQWLANGTHIYNGNTGNVGIGVNTPASKLHLFGSMLMDGTNPTFQLQNAGVDKGFLQLSGNNLRLGTNSANNSGRVVLRTDNSDRVIVDSTGNVQILGLQDASLTTHGYLTLGAINSTNLILDRNEIMARNNGAASNLVLQYDGGNVGLGVVSPIEKIEVEGSARLNGGARLLKFETSVAGTIGQFSVLKYAPGLQFIRSDNTVLGKIEYVDTLSFSNFLRLYTGATPSNALTVSTSNYVGIGTADPVAKLHVRGANNLDEVAISSGFAGQSATMQFYNNGATEKRGFVQLDDYDVKIGTNSGNVNGRFVIRTDGADRMFVDEAGNVSIATTQIAAGYKLHVGGKAICEELKVQLKAAWPDYVFGDKYRLTPLDELKKFVETNKHLPGIPAAAEVERNGIEVGDMQKRLMEKVEELTLYVISLKEEIEALKKNQKQ